MQEDKNIENLVSKMMQDLAIDSPALDFTNAVMSQVENLESKNEIVYKPLISKPLWVLLGFVLVVITSYLFMNTSAEETTWLSTLNFSSFTNNNFTQSLTTLKLPKTFIYAILFLGIMVCIQVPLLKNYFDKKLSL
ncbi:MAG: hypothetical protein ACPG6B_04890 [Oceanihabitans sp.]